MKHRFYVAAAITAVLAGCSGSQPEDCKIFTRCSTGGPVGGGGTGLLTVTQDNALDSLREAWLGASIFSGYARASGCDQCWRHQWWRRICRQIVEPAHAFSRSIWPHDVQLPDFGDLYGHG